MTEAFINRQHFTPTINIYYYALSSSDADDQRLYQANKKT
jgi:hypothetical protein